MNMDSPLNGLTAITLAFLGDLYCPLRWLMLLATVLIAFDVRWGIAAARKRGEVIRFSKAGRRAINKTIDYFCWVTIAGIIENVFAAKFSVEGIPVGQLLLLIFIYAFEIDSCYSNYCEARNIRNRWNILGWVGKRFSLERKNENEEMKD
jgi:hypothetical protein